ncbi:MAG: CvpA family protein [Candidatus Aminicenantes bacterium]|nr:CvpA family protein [Candidatus Aminicenantes bacterium]HHF51308.1 CvpA family protein [Candidatus Aminicenantes bacterium]
MAFNWMDVILLLILIVTVILGLIKGLVRQLIGILAVVVGVIFAMAYYPYVSQILKPLFSNEVIAHFLGFMLIFIATLILGWMLGRLFSKAMKGSLKFLNHLLGGGLGFIKGVLICGIIIFALMVFPVQTNALKGSELAPYCLKVTQAAIDLVPLELKEKFNKAYNEIVNKNKGEEDAKRV